MKPETSMIPANTVRSGRIIELFIILLLGVILFIISSHYDILESITAYSQRYEHLQIDEILVLSVFYVFVLAVFSVRRWIEVTRSEKVLQEQNAVLEKTLQEIKYLKGIIPICASCKKILNDNGIWDELEIYISSHSEADFSHGICPDCMIKLYPDFFHEDSENS